MGNTQWGLGIRPFFIFFIYIFFVTMAHKCHMTTCCSEQERLALIKFKHSVTDYNGMLSTWGVGNDCCSWERVGCDNVTGRVVSLHLRTNVGQDYYNIDLDNYLSDEYYGTQFGADEKYIVGDELNSCLTELVDLKHLDLSGNDFQQSRLPEFIGSLKQLRYLNLSAAGFSGNIPHQIGNLSNLEVLDLSSSPYYSPNMGTQFMADDMAWINHGLPKLEHLDLGGVNLSRTKNLDDLLYRIPSLPKLSLSRCSLSMAHLGSHHLNSSRELLRIKQLDLSENGFRGQLPGFFLNMTSLVFLDLSNNDFSMSWSFENLLNKIPFVSELHLSGCKLQVINLSPVNLNSSKHSNIQHLDLSWNEIEGRFPPALTNMSSLLSLDLSENRLNSFIPVMPNLLKLDISENNLGRIENVGIWRQCHLKELIVSRNNLEGEMIAPATNISQCSQFALRLLDLSFNELVGPIPEALGKLTSSAAIFLNSNKLTGSVPVSLGRLASLRVFSVSSNLLNGTIPSSVGQLTKLYLLDISNNSLQGVVSEDHFANLSMLEYLDANYNNNLRFNISREWIPPFQLKVVRLGSCKIEDGFPQWFRNQRKLKELVLSNASIFGPLPTWLRRLPIIPILDLSNNKLTGPLTNLPSVYEVRFELGGILLLKNNLFTGLIPRWLCARTDLKVLDFSRNRFTGKIPKCLWDISLHMMVLSSNRLSGVMPSSLASNSSLQWLQLNDNNFDGELPRTRGYFINLEVLDLGENKISGNIPEWIGENLGLNVIRLRKNNFSGEIPHSLCNCFYLQIIDLAHNNLKGSIPHCFNEFDGMKDDSMTYSSYWGEVGYGNMIQYLKGVALEYTKTLKFVRNVDLSSNKLSGEIPEVLTTLEALMGLNLSYNRFSGGIPKNIGNMKSLNSLDLSVNKLSGMIPPSLAALHFLSHLNLSHNNLSGQIPTGNQLQTLTDPSIYVGNTYLCGSPLPKECSPHDQNTTSKNKHENGDEPKELWFYLDIMSGFATGFWGIIGVLALKKQWRHKLFMFVGKSLTRYRLQSRLEL